MLAGSVAMLDLRQPSKFLPWVFDKSRAFLLILDNICIIMVMERKKELKKQIKKWDKEFDKLWDSLSVVQ